MRGISVFYRLAPEVESFLSEYTHKDFDRLVDASRGEMVCEPDRVVHARRRRISVATPQG